jgi:hypothetical protein
MIATALIAAGLLAVAAWVLAHPRPLPRPHRAHRAPDLRSYAPIRDKD